ncbi:MAG: hypothetical protein MZV70_47095 [Desulfobacterales bacterium]|nr:hypothetical protein [Desulfobacterales bacterium]
MICGRPASARIPGRGCLDPDALRRVLLTEAAADAILAAGIMPPGHAQGLGHRPARALPVRRTSRSPALQADGRHHEGVRFFVGQFHAIRRVAA